MRPMSRCNRAWGAVAAAPADALQRGVRPWTPGSHLTVVKLTSGQTKIEQWSNQCTRFAPHSRGDSHSPATSPRRSAPRPAHRASPRRSLRGMARTRAPLCGARRGNRHSKESNPARTHPRQRYINIKMYRAPRRSRSRFRDSACRGMLVGVVGVVGGRVGPGRADRVSRDGAAWLEGIGRCVSESARRGAVRRRGRWRRGAGSLRGEVGRAPPRRARSGQMNPRRGRRARHSESERCSASCAEPSK